jgi:hypothetical protein
MLSAERLKEIEEEIASVRGDPDLRSDAAEELLAEVHELRKRIERAASEETDWKALEEKDARIAEMDSKLRDAVDLINSGSAYCSDCGLGTRWVEYTSGEGEG